MDGLNEEELDDSLESDGESSWLKAKTFANKRLAKLIEKIAIVLWSLFVLICLVGVGSWILWGAFGVQGERLTKLVSILDQHWKGIGLLLLPIFYRTTRSLLERVRQVGSVKLDGSGGGSLAAPNPPKTMENT